MERPSAGPEIIYNRGGNLATITRLDREKTDEYMRRTDMRRWIVISDSDEKPQSQATQVGLDVLAWRRIIPINELLATRFRPQPFHTLKRDDAGPAPVWQIAVHEREIDKQIRDGHFIDRPDYEDQFLKKLNKAVKSGLLEALRREKLGWHDQGKNYAGQLFTYITMFAISNLNYLIHGDNLTTTIYPYWLLASITIGLINVPPKQETRSSFLYEGPDLLRMVRNWRKAMDGEAEPFPDVPFRNWLRGKVFLARNGHAMIVRKQD